MKVWDLHCDTLSVMRDSARAGKPLDFAKNDLHIHLDSLQKGDYGLQCMAAFINLADAPADDPLVCVMEQADLFHQILAAHPDKLAPVYTAADIDRNAADGKISLMFTVEEAGCCKGSIPILRGLHRLGVRMMSLTWNHENEVAYPNLAPPNVDDILPCDPDLERGLKPLGRDFLAEMERLHITLDVSHLSDKGFWDVAACAARPFAASHSNCRAISGHSRNLTDDMIRFMGEHGCLAGLNYCAGFLEPDLRATRSTVDRVAQHAAYFKNLGGLDMIALGSDFDGISHGPGMASAADLPMLEAALRRAGFTEREIEAVFWGNARRFFMQNL